MNMSFQEWSRNGWIHQRETSPEEIAGLQAVVDRDLSTCADPNLDPDWRFAIAYNAALQCATLALRTAGYEVPKGGGAHFRTIDSLRLTLGDDGTVVNTLQAFRAKRGGGGIYESTGIASEAEIEELRALALNLKDRVTNWVKANHAPLLAQIKTPSARNRPGGSQGKPPPKR